MSNSENQLRISGKIDTLLDHQSQRLEDISNNAIDFIRINLLVVGLFTPIVATLLRDEFDLTTLLASPFAFAAIITWFFSMWTAAYVYRSARTKSMSQFDKLEEGVVEEWREVDFRDEILGSNNGYQSQVRSLVNDMTFTIIASLATVYYLGVAGIDSFVGFEEVFRNYLLALPIFPLVGVFGLVKIEEIVDYRNFAYHFRDALNLILRRLVRLISHLDSIKETECPEDQENYIYGTFEEDNGQKRYALDDLKDQIIGVSDRTSISPTRLRFLITLVTEFGVEAFRYAEVKQKFESDYDDVGITRRLIKREVDKGFLERVAQANSTFLINTRTEQVYFDPTDIDEDLKQESKILIRHLKGNAQEKEFVENKLDVENVETYFDQNSGFDFEAVEKLNRAIDVIEESEEYDFEPDIGKFEWRKAATKYRITSKTLSIYYLLRLQELKIQSVDSLEDYLIMRTANLVEDYITDLCALTGIQTEDEYNLREKMNRLMKEEPSLMKNKDISEINSFWDLRNRFLHGEKDHLEELDSHWDNIEEILSRPL